MFKPKFNKVLVEINDEDAKWGSGNDGSMLGASYREGKLIDVGEFVQTADYPLEDKLIIRVREEIDHLVGKTVMWHEGTEAGTIFEEAGKKYALIYWFDIIGEKDEQ